MGKDKSIIEKFTETMKGLAESAAEALKAEEPPRADTTGAAYMPFAAEGLVADPLLVPPLAARPVRPKKGAAKKTARRGVRRRRLHRRNLRGRSGGNRRRPPELC